MPKRTAAALVTLLFAVCCECASIIPPENLGELARRSGAVVLARAGASNAVRRGQLIFTRTRFRVVEPVRGPLGRDAALEVEVPGGVLGDEGWAVGGSPTFAPGGTYLLFAVAGENDTWRLPTLAWGLLVRVPADEGTALLRPVDEATSVRPFPRRDGILPEATETYLESRLIPHLRNVAAGTARWDAAQVRAPRPLVPFVARAAAAPAICSFMTYLDRRIRWQEFDQRHTIRVWADAAGDPSIAGGGFAEVQGAIGDWNGVPGSSLSLSYAGSQTYQSFCKPAPPPPTPKPWDYPPSGVNMIYFNDPCGDLPPLQGCSGTLSFGGPYFLGEHSFDGSTWYTAISLFVVVNEGTGSCLGSNDYRLLVAHEMGHGLGFDHVEDPTALMSIYCCNPIGATDRTCASYLYPGPAGPTPTPTTTPIPVLRAGFSLAPNNPEARVPVRFTDASTGAITWVWDFGDGTGSTERNPVHTYAFPGFFRVVLRVTDGVAEATATRTVAVTEKVRKRLLRR